MSRDGPIRLALVGGGPGSFIGGVHRMAALLDGRFAIVAGAFSRDARKSRERGAAWGIDPARAHAGHGPLLTAEAVRRDGIEAVAIATPNASHALIAADALAAGLHVVCDKPMTATLEEALQLASAVRLASTVFALTYTYTGYPMVRAARAQVAAGALGAVRKVVVDYAQGWLATAIEGENRQAAWRTDPAEAGAGGCVGDIGVHAFQLAEYISGLRVESLCADLPRVVPGRQLDDDCNILLRFGGGAPGALIASQIATGERNALRLRVYGERASLEWSHEEPGLLRRHSPDGRSELLYAGGEAAGPDARSAARLPPGHPEGFIEAFATIYRDVADAICGDRRLVGGVLPGIDDGVRSMRFIDAAVRSHERRSWLTLEGS
jgi:predicted dehydrogenase